jgi:flagellar biosynthesis protein
MKRKDTPARMTPEEARRTAVALTYDASSSAPRVVAKGRGLIAQAIVERAKAAGVYVHESPELVALLMQVELDDAIPPQLYVAVAELLAWLYALDRAAAPSPALLPPQAPSRGTD